MQPAQRLYLELEERGGLLAERQFGAATHQSFNALRLKTLQNVGEDQQQQLFHPGDGAEMPCGLACQWAKACARGQGGVRRRQGPHQFAEACELREGLRPGPLEQRAFWEV
ncbi:hypothetical protein LILAB_08155 [Corallococcus macrosporus]|uniref:Uncharacterized protein n=1 Tax=Myxococcus fulvus (strain ATCC BAA-855 / HW-1) TaxID=483219 RepID=F8CE81_MYXFH|nr:hypothetical protein LILAB_08155 [Corallococcus macrosporus]